MAEMPDWLNKKVLILRRSDLTLPDSQMELQVRFQENVFRDNSQGWQDQIQAEIIASAFHVDLAEISNFMAKAEQWLALPIQHMGSVFFAGTWEFGDRSKNHQLTLAFGPHLKTPSKTDWFAVDIHLGIAGFFWHANFHVDQSALSLFVAGLRADSL